MNETEIKVDEIVHYFTTEWDCPGTKEGSYRTFYQKAVTCENCKQKLALPETQATIRFRKAVYGI